MYDTIKISMATPACKKKHIKEYYEWADTTTGEINFKGKIKNMLIRYVNNKLTIEGSLAKFQYGNNIQLLTKQDALQAILELSNMLNLPLFEGTVERLDVGILLQMNESLQSYYPYLGDLPCYGKNTYGNDSVSYQTKFKTLCFYDKFKEATKLIKNNPDLHIDKNSLRIESRLLNNKQICKSLKLPEIKVKDLFNTIVPIKAINFLEESYLSIHKYKDQKSIVKIDFGDFSLKEFDRQCRLNTIYNLGESNIYSQIEANKKPSVNRMAIKRLKDHIKKTKGNLKTNEPNKLIEELDKKLSIAVDSLRYSYSL